MTALSRRLLAAGYYSSRLIAGIGRPFGLAPDSHLRVLLYHDVTPGEQPRFAAQLRWVARRWQFISPRQFAAIMSGEEDLSGRSVLLTFDDGYASNRVVAEQVLKPMNIRALFFAIPEFASLHDRAEVRHFISQRIVPGRPVGELPAHLSNMRWTDFEALLEQGHAVGAHTETHARLSNIGSHTELEREIVGSGDTLAQRLGVSIDHFAYPFGDVASFSEPALHVARRRFRFVHSGLRGDNARPTSPLAVRRDSATPTDSNALIGAWIEGVADFHYARSRAKLDGWI